MVDVDVLRQGAVRPESDALVVGARMVRIIEIRSDCVGGWSQQRMRTQSKRGDEECSFGEQRPPPSSAPYRRECNHHNPSAHGAGMFGER